MKQISLEEQRACAPLNGNRPFSLMKTPPPVPAAVVAQTVSITKTTQPIVELVAERSPLDVAGLIIPQGSRYYLVVSRYATRYYCVAYLNGAWQFSGEDRIRDMYIRQVQYHTGQAIA